MRLGWRQQGTGNAVLGGGGGDVHLKVPVESSPERPGSRASLGAASSSSRSSPIRLCG